jgi:hypothetical protein
MVLLRRFDPTGEELARWEPLARDAEGAIAFLSPPKAEAAALAPPQDADIHVGDLIATVPAEAAAFPEKYATGLFVVTPLGVKAAPQPPKELGGPWLAAWGQDACDMLLASTAADRRRLVLASCDCAETVLHFVPAGEDRPRRALEVARAWCRGDASLDDVRSAEAAAKAVGSTASPLTAVLFAAVAPTYVCAVATTSDAGTTAASAAGGPFSAGWANATAVPNLTPKESTYLALAPLVRRWIPLPVVLLSGLGYPDAIPFDPGAVP